MKKLLGKLICAVAGHKRGKRIDGPRDAQINGEMQRIIVYKCPRCGDGWHRKVKSV